MPAIEGIVLLLESQFDADTIPEAAIPASDTKDAPDHDHRSVDVYVPSYLGSQFWISYAVNPAMLAPANGQAKYIFFKIVLDGECLVSWGVGEREEWKGKTMWALVCGEDHGGWRTVDKRAFFFRPTADDQDFDIVAYRARGRRRAPRHFAHLPPPGQTGFDLVSWGRLKKHQPQQFYQYALLDPIDQPYATFRYHVRGGPHIHTHQSGAQVDQYSSSDSYSSDYEEGEEEGDEPSEVVEELPAASQIRRLSYPPTICLAPASSRGKPLPPVKLDPVAADPSELDMSTILDPEPPVISVGPASGSSKQFQKFKDGESRTSSVDTVIHRKHSLRTPTPIIAEKQATNTPPSSLRKRSGAKIKEWFGSMSKRRATRSASPIHPSLEHKSSSASLS